MAAVGSPYLATWNRSDNTLRLFQLSGEQFVQVGTNSVVQGSDVTNDPLVRWSRDGNHLTTHAKASLAAASGLWKTFDLLLTQTAQTTKPTSGLDGVAAWGYMQGFFNNHDYFHCFTGTPAWVGVNADGSHDASNGSASLIVANRVTANNPADTFSIWGSTTNTLLYPLTGHDTYGYGTTFGTARDLAVISKSLEWSSDGRFFMIGTSTNSLQFWTMGATVAAAVNTQTVTLPGAVQHVRMSTDTRFIAVSYMNGSAYETRVYQRMGAALKLIKTITDFGKTLDWTADGTYLMDAGSKKAVKYVGSNTFDALDSLVTNLPANVVVSRISPHSAVAANTVSLYDVGLPLIVGKGFDTANTKVALMDSTAAFNSADTSASAILSGKQVSGNNWPVGGMVLQNIVYTGTGVGTMVMKADKVRRTLAGGTITFKNLLVYDATSNKPLIFIAMAALVFVDDGATLGVDFSTPGLVLFAT